MPTDLDPNAAGAPPAGEDAGTKNTPPADGAKSGTDAVTPPSGDDTKTTPPAGDATTPPKVEGKENTFEIPDAFKEKGWAEHLKSTDDLWNKIDNLQKFTSQKNATPDFEKATPQEIEDYFKESRPEDKGDYNFKTSEDYEETGMEEGFSTLLHEAGVTKYQGDLLIKGYQDMEAKQKDALFDTDTFMKEMEGVFGNGFEVKLDQTRQFIEGNLNDAQKKSLNDVPNSHLKLIYELANNISKSYGASESGKGGESQPGFTPKASTKERQSELRAQIREKDKSMHLPNSYDEKQALIRELDETYKTKK
ncbi:MAG: hypothetical protein V3U75_13385 [Methylococcaceae bacterium]